MKHFIYAALIGAMGFASCANDDVVSNNQTTTGALKINAGIALHKVTRAFDNQWNKGDEIGVSSFHTMRKEIKPGYREVDLKETSDAIYDSIKKALKDGIEVQGVRLESSKSLLIK